MAVKYDPARPMSQPPAGHDQIGLTRLKDYTLGRWGGVNLGIYNNRAIRGGTSASVHRDGRAWDYKAQSYQMLSEVWDFWIAHADALNIQEIHDYAGNRAGEQRAWRTGVGWHPANVGMGPLGPYTHVERNWDGAKDTRTIPEIVAGATTFRPSSPTEESDGIDMTPEELKNAVEAGVLNALTTWQRAEEIKGIQQTVTRRGVLDGELDLIRSAEYKATEVGIVKDGTA